MESSPVPKEIIVRGKKVFLLLWEYLAGNAPLESVSRYIDTDADRLDRIESVYAIFYGVNTKCVDCHEGFKRAGRLSSQVVEGGEHCLCICCTAPLGYSECGYCHRVDGAVELLVAVTQGGGLDPERWESIRDRFRTPHLAYLEVRVDIVESQFKISEDQIESACLEERLKEQGVDPVAFADWVKTKSLGNFIEPTSAEWAQGAIAEANQEAVQEAEQDAEQDLLYLAQVLPAAQPAPIEEPEPENPVEDDGWGPRAVPSDPDDGWGCAPSKVGGPHDPWSGW